MIFTEQELTNRGASEDFMLSDRQHCSMGMFSTAFLTAL